MFQKIGLQVYRAPQPDVVRVPFGMDDSSRRALRAEPRRPLFPSRIVEAWLEPPLPGSLSSISPKDGLRQHGRLGQRRYIIESALVYLCHDLRVHLDLGAVIGHDPIALRLHIA